MGYTGHLARNPGMYPDWESNRWPFGSQSGTQSTEPHQPGPQPHFLMCVCSEGCPHCLTPSHSSAPAMWPLPHPSWGHHISFQTQWTNFSWSLNTLKNCWTLLSFWNTLWLQGHIFSRFCFYFFCSLSLTHLTDGIKCQTGHSLMSQI